MRRRIGNKHARPKYATADKLPEHIAYTPAQKERLLEKKIRALAALDEHRILQQNDRRGGDAKSRPRRYAQPPYTMGGGSFGQPEATSFGPPPPAYAPEAAARQTLYPTSQSPSPPYASYTSPPPYAAFTPSSLPATYSGGQFASLNAYTPPYASTFTQPPPIQPPFRYTQMPPYAAFTAPTPRATSTIPEPPNFYTRPVPPPYAAFTPPPPTFSYTQPPSTLAATSPVVTTSAAQLAPVLYTHPPWFISSTLPPSTTPPPPPPPRTYLTPPPPAYTPPTLPPPPTTTTPSPSSIVTRPPPPLNGDDEATGAGGDTVPRDFASWKAELGLPDDISESPDAGEPGKIVVLQPWAFEHRLGERRFVQRSSI